MKKEVHTDNEIGKKARGWDAIETKLKDCGLSAVELAESQKSFYDGIEVLSKMFLVCYDTEKNHLV